MADDRERHTGGEYKETVTPDNALDVLRQVQKPFQTASEVADKLDCSPDTARRKLSKLDDVDGDGTIRRQDVGSSATVWWLLPPEAAEERPEQRLQRLSQELDEAIIVGDTVYEDGDQHPLSDAQTAPEETADDGGE